MRIADLGGEGIEMSGEVSWERDDRDASIGRHALIDGANRCHRSQLDTFQTGRMHSRLFPASSRDPGAGGKRIAKLPYSTPDLCAKSHSLPRRSHAIPVSRFLAVCPLPFGRPTVIAVDCLGAAAAAEAAVLADGVHVVTLLVIPSFRTCRCPSPHPTADMPYTTRYATEQTLLCISVGCSPRQGKQPYVQRK